MTAPTKRREGFALMAALWIVVLVGVAGYELSARARTRRLAVANALEMVQARAAADAGLESARGALEQRLRVPFTARAFRSVDATLDPLGDLSFVPADTTALDAVRSVATVRDAGAFLQINRATEDDVRRFLVALPMDTRVAERVAQRILDWRDADRFPRAHGAERDDYLRAGARVLPSDADFRRVEELREVDGVTADVYARIAPYLSVSGSGRINVNSAPRVVLRSLPGLGDEAVDVLYRARESTRPLRTLSELSVRLGAGGRQALLDAMPDLMPRVVFETTEIAVRSTGWVDGSPIRARESALYQRSGDALTVIARRIDQ